MVPTGNYTDYMHFPQTNILAETEKNYSDSKRVKMTPSDQVNLRPLFEQTAPYFLPQENDPMEVDTPMPTTYNITPQQSSLSRFSEPCLYRGGGGGCLYKFSHFKLMMNGMESFHDCHLGPCDY